MTPATYDAVIVGGGHNGLVAAFYLARAGLRPLVLERREIVGGCCVTEEFAPGYRASTGAYVLSMLHDQVSADMRIAARGLRVDPAGPTLNLFEDGHTLLTSDDMDATRRELERFSPADAEALGPFEERLGEVARLVLPLADSTPPDLASLRPGDLANVAGLAARGARHRRLVDEALYLFATSAAQYLGEWFESEHVRAAFGWHAINDSSSGPSTPGTAFVLLHDHFSDAADGVRSWGFVRGGMGVLTELMAQAAREAGAEIRTGAEVARILVEDGRARGVELVDGERIVAERVVSNADPVRTFDGLLGADALPAPFLAAVRAYRCEGTSVKINLAVNRLPHAAAYPADGVQPYHGGVIEITPTIAAMDWAQAQARAGVPADDPHVELCIPTVHDASLAPPGKHVITIDVSSSPYTLASGTWDAIADEVADRAIAKIERYFPGLSDSIEHRQVLSPLGLERTLGISGGHALHGDMSFDQLFNLRPVRGWADYRTPIDGLYLCGAGTHPGGGVTGTNGRNCVRELLRDRRRPRARLDRAVRKRARA